MPPPPGLNLVNLVPAHILHNHPTYYRSSSRSYSVRTTRQFIIHCGKSWRRLRLIEFALYFVAGCLSLGVCVCGARRLRGDSVSGRPSATVVGGGGGVERRREERATLPSPPLFLQEPPPPSLLSSRTSPPPPLSSASVLQNNQLVVNNVHCSCKAEQQLHIDVSKIDFINAKALTDNRSDRKKTVNNCKQTRLKSCLRVCLISPKQS